MHICIGKERGLLVLAAFTSVSKDFLGGFEVLRSFSVSRYIKRSFQGSNAYMVLQGSITVGTLLALIQLSGTFSTPVLVLLQSYPQMKGMKSIIKKLGELADDETDWEEEGLTGYSTKYRCQPVFR